LFPSHPTAAEGRLMLLYP